MPSDAVGMGVRYTPLVPPDSIVGVDAGVEVFVGHIVSPKEFWLQLRGKGTTMALEDVMDKLE